MIIKVKQYQTIWDIALQYAGSLEAAMDILVANHKTTTQLLNGEELLIPKIYSKKIQQFYNSENVNIASSVLALDDDGFLTPAPILPTTIELLNESGGLILSFIANENQINQHILANNVVFVNEIETLSINANNDVSIVIQDQNGNVPNNAVIATTSPNEMTITVEELPTPIGAIPTKTGQTTSITSNDDGDDPAGRGESFNLLDIGVLNPFGSNYRRTGITGGVHVSSGVWHNVNGGVVNAATAFPSGVFVDWSTYNGTTVMLYVTSPTLGRLVDHIPSALALTLEGLSSWKVVNFNEMVSIARMPALTPIFDYSPLNIPNNVVVVSSSTGITAGNSHCMCRNFTGSSRYITISVFNTNNYAIYGRLSNVNIDPLTNEVTFT